MFQFKYNTPNSSGQATQVLQRRPDCYITPTFQLMKTSKSFSWLLSLNYILASPWTCVAEFEAFRRDLTFHLHQFHLAGFSLYLQPILLNPEKGTLLHCWWACKLVQPLCKTVWRFRFLKLKIELPYDPTIPLLGIHPEKTLIPKDTCTPKVIAALFTTAKTWKQSKCPSIDE